MQRYDAIASYLLLVTEAYGGWAKRENKGTFLYCAEKKRRKSKQNKKNNVNKRKRKQ